MLKRHKISRLDKRHCAIHKKVMKVTGKLHYRLKLHFSLSLFFELMKELHSSSTDRFLCTSIFSFHQQGRLDLVTVTYGPASKQLQHTHLHTHTQTEMSHLIWILMCNATFMFWELVCLTDHYKFYQFITAFERMTFPCICEPLPDRDIIRALWKGSTKHTEADYY